MKKIQTLLIALCILLFFAPLTDFAPSNVSYRTYTPIMVGAAMICLATAVILEPKK